MKLKLITIFLLIFLIGCGQKVNHNVRGEVKANAEASTDSSVWLDYERMFNGWVNICNNLYPDNQFENFKCRKEAADRLATMLTLNLTEIPEEASDLLDQFNNQEEEKNE